MSIEDIVKQALIQSGRSLPVDTEPEPDTYTSVEQDKDTETRQALAEVMIEFIRKQHIPFAQVSMLRRVVKRILMHLCTETSACTLSNVKNVIDPRFRTYVEMILHEMTRQGILVVFNDDTTKLRWSVKHELKAHAIMFATEK